MATLGFKLLLCVLTIQLIDGQMPGEVPVLDVPESITINQNLRAGHLIAISRCTFSADVFYRILNANSSVLQVDPVSGELRLAVNSSDLEIDIYMTTLECFSQSLEDRAVITVERVEENEFSPNFTTNLNTTVSVAENTSISTVIIQLMATDDDIGIYGIIEYSINTPGLDPIFTIDTATGRIMLASRLDYEENMIYQFDVYASNPPSPTTGGVLNDTILVTVRVVDVDDTSPTFDMTGGYMHSLLENYTEPANFLNISCTDTDTETSRIQYGINSAGRVPFTLDLNTGQLSLITGDEGGLDYEFITFYALSVICFDNSLLNSSSTTTVDISILPLNEGSPQITKRVTGILRLNEYSPVGSILVSTLRTANISIRFMYSAVDDDTGPDGNITYTFESPLLMDYFNLDLITGEMTIERPLDFDTNNSLTEVAASGFFVTSLIVTICDIYPPPPTSTCPRMSIFIIVSPNNEFSPQFSQGEYSVSVLESIGFNELVLRVNCTDEDLIVGAFMDIDFINASRSVLDNFIIDHATGEIRVNTSLDYEATTNYGFHLRCRDNEGLEAQTVVTVEILPVNDNRPLFSQPNYEFSVSRTTPSNRYPIGQVVANDEDVGLGGDLFYFVEPNPFFDIAGDGTILLINSIQNDSSPGVRFDAVVYDGPNSTFNRDTAFVIITFTDGNMIVPNFQIGSRVVEISELLSAGSEITTIRCIDSEEGLNGIIEYSIQNGNTDNIFSIDSVTGVISVAAVLTLPQNISAEEYPLTVTCEDFGVPRLSDRATIFIRILQDDSSPPVISNNTIFIFVEENTTMNTIITTIDAIDLDTENLDFRLQNESHPGVFIIDPPSGQVILTARLDREIVGMYYLTVVVTERRVIAGPERSDQAVLIILVRDVNDNDPLCNRTSLVVTVPDTIEQGDDILSLNCLDADIGNNGNLTYHLVDDFGVLAVDFLGVVYLENDLEAVDINILISEVIVSDQGIPVPRTNSYHISITIVSTNRNIPSFSNLPDTIIVPESAPVQDTVFTVMAEDPDRGSFGQLTYGIIVSSERSKFEIIPNTGRILLREKLNFFEQQVHTLNISVEDSDYVVTEVLMINVLDVNEFSPSCEETHLISSLAEGLPPNQILNPGLNCSDEDLGSNGELIYTIISGNNEGIFTVDSEGVIMAQQSLDFEQVQFYILLLTVSDNSESPFSVNASVRVVVQPVNEFVPSFPSSEYVANISEASTVGTNIITVAATDGDSSEHRDGQIEYSISGPDSLPFTVNSNGLVQVARDLDREEQELFSVTVTASDQGIPPRTAETIISITLVDVDDNPPVFTQPFYLVNHTQQNNSQESVLTVRCDDLDAGPNAVVMYTLDPTFTDSQFFQVSNSGVIEINGLLAISRSYSFSVICTGPPPANKFDRAVVTIVAVVNTTITFSPSSTYTRTVAEDTDPIFDVLTISASSSTNASLTYSFLSGSSIFRVESTTGIVRLANVLDYEMEQSFVLRVGASDNGDPPNLAEAVVNILVENINDERPLITTIPLIVNLTEGPTLMTELLLDMECRDEDDGVFGETSFLIEDGNLQDTFAISNSGTLSLVGDVDYETTRSFSLDVVCMDGGSPALRDSIVLSINVLPVNDNPPEFQQESFSILVDESVPVNSPISDSVTATDLDLPPHNNIHYTIISGNTFPPTFEIAPTTGQLTLVQPLDFEAVQVYTIEVLAEDGGGSQVPGFTIMNDTATIQINVRGVNDNSPMLSNSIYSGNIAEEAGVGAQVVLVDEIVCTDADLGQDGEIYFSVTDSTFQIHPTSGIVTAIENLNFETQTSHTVSVQCIDRGTPPMSSMATLFVTITDVNEFSPRFVNESGYSFSVLESASVGEEIGMIRAIDGDAGEAGIVSYHFNNSSEVPFSLNRESGVIVLMDNLDFETQTHQYSLRATARDNAGNSNEVTVIINILNVDDNLPIFAANVYFFSVIENAAVDTSIGLVSCSDADNTALNIPVTYSIATSPFEIDSTGGEIRVTELLDLESIPRYSVGVVCMDTEGNTGSATVTISLLPFNDFMPVFLQSGYFTSVVENSPTGTSLLQVRATDDDIVDYFTIDYTIISGNSGGLFSIDRANGVVRVNQNIDRETAPVYILIVQAQNPVSPGDTSGSSPLNSTTTVMIQVLDVNDNSPVISPANPPPVFILESDGPSAFVLQLNCSDIDNGSNGTTSLSILSSGSAERFEILDGTLRTTTIIRTNEVVTVSCRDSGTPPLSSSVDISVSIMSVNDHPPMFNSSNYTVMVAEDTIIGEVVSCINATDRDGADTPDGIVRYSLLFLGSGTDKFRIVEDTGCIFVSIALDFDLTMLFEYVIIVTDMGVMPLQGNASLVIEITDAVRDPPRIEFASYTRQLPENTPIRILVAEIRCTDPDVNDTITYSIVDPTSEFVIDPTFGNLTIAANLDFEISESHTFRVACTDSFGLEDQADVSVTVLPVNEYPPTFFSAIVDIEENSIIGREVTTLVWMDNDNGVDGEVDFSIISGNINDVFSITSDGTIFVRGNLDRESISEYYINISISDRSLDDPRSSVGQLNVTVTDINDNLPQFVQDPYMFGPLEGNETLGYPVGIVRCTDNDTEDNALTTFRLSPDNQNFSLFAIDSVNGQIMVNGNLRAREVDTIAFTILCINVGNPPLVGTTRVLVRVEEINRNAPEFSNTSYHIEVPEDTGILDDIILTVEATDADFGINGQIRYSLLDTFNGRFFIDERSGDLTLIQPLNFEEQTMYTLIAIAMDGAVDSSLRLRSSVEITIQVLGVNEHIPRCRNAIYVEVINVTSEGRIIDFLCMDDDEGLDGEVVYSIIDGNDDGYFLAENDSLFIPESFFPQNGIEQFMLRISVSDLGNPSRSVLIEVIIVYSFDNLNPPIFNPVAYTLSVNELTEVGTVVATLTATDSDPSIQGQITYSVINSDNFRINANSGNLFLASPLDWETVPFLTFTVRAEDRDPLFPLFDMATVNVTVINNNDNLPQCDRIFYTSQIPSNASIGATVLTLNCTDLDRNALTYSIVSQTTPYNIDTNTGRIFVVGQIIETSYLIDVEVFDGGVERTTITVSIGTLFTNQESPAFSVNQYVFFVAESASILTTVGSVLASDSDSDISDLMFSLVDPGMGEFYVNPTTGDLVLTVALDFETVQQYRFNVSVSDRGSFDGSNILSSTASVLVNVNNTNDNQPIFSNGGIYGRTIPETTPVGTSILTISCTDNDAAPFGSPSINSDNFSHIPFDLREISLGEGEVRVSEVLAGPNAYFLNITCSDGITQNVNGQIFLFVPEPLAPVFSEPVYEWFISENVGTRGVYTSIQATSNDNSDITYSIADGNDDDIFFIDPSSGSVSLVVTLDYETQRRHGLIIRAVDESNRESNVLLLVQVTDANDQLPLIPPSALLRIRQNESPGYPVGVVECIDADANINNTAFNYTFSPSSDLFSVDESGIIRLEVGLNNTPVHVLPIVCFDIRDPDVNSTGIVTIEVEFVNLHQPVFQNPLYIFQVREDLPSLTLVGDPVVAIDNDIGSFGQLVYSIGDEQDQFYVEAGTGRVGLLTALDRESQELHSLTVLAIDGGPSAVDSSRMTGSTTVMVIVEDANDNAPTPNQLSYVQSITTNHTVLSPVLSVNCSDPDLGNNGDIQYSLSPVDTLDNFVIQSSGTIILAQEQLNQAVYSFFAVCTDGGNPSLSSSSLVTITVNFIVLSAPVFDQDHYNVSISEDIAVTTSILTVQATPSDSSITVVYDLNGGNDRESFFVNSITGEISIRNPLDAREQQIYTLTIRAGNTGSDQLFSYATVSVFVEDINDNSPIFESQFYAGTITEGSTLSTPVVRVVCTDSDVNSEISYTITNGLSSLTEFNITQDGQISVSGSVDYELVTGYSLEVTCSDGGLVPRTAVATVRIDVTPVNEFPPQFMRDEYTFEATENDFGALIGRVNATDEDDGPHGSITYLLQDPGNFSVIFVDPTSGDVLVQNNLDYEAQPFWNLSVIARDGGGLESSVLLNIEIINVNDVFPVLEPEASLVSIPVDREAGSPVQFYDCSDADGSNTSLSIVSGNSMRYFEFSSNNILLWTGRASDLISNSVVSLTLRCQDSLDGEQYDESVIAISIIVTDAIQPLFSEQLYSVFIPEDAEINITILTVSAEGENPGIFYDLLSLPPDFPFLIDFMDGNISLVRSLNSEIVSFYSFFAGATDPITGAIGISLIQVTIIDINDNPPIIAPSIQSLSLSENLSAFTSPFTFFSCTDSDSGLNDDISFAITSGDEFGFFRIDSDGRVYVIQPLDFESTSNYTLEITCSDNTISPLTDTATLLVSVTGYNEHPPVFNPPVYFFYVSESALIGHALGSVSALDNDMGVDGRIIYSFISTALHFIINEISGELFLSRELNFEEQARYDVVVEARDRANDRFLQMTSTADIVIEVTETNEHAPRCLNAIYVGVVNATSEGRIIDFLCMDDDEGLDGELTYGIIGGNEDGYFLAENDSLVIPESFYPENGREQFMLQISVGDLGNPSRNISIEAVVIYSFDNRNAPVFDQASYNVDVNELTEVGTVVATLTATDSDPSIQGQITYSVINSDNFRINANSGNLFLASPLDWETVPFLTFTVRAEDRDPLFPLFDMATVNVTVINNNDNLPQCDRIFYTSQIPSNASIGATVLTLNCIDLDRNVLTYSIVSQTTPYNIDTNTGRIFVAGFLVADVTSLFSVTITGAENESINVSVTITTLFSNTDHPSFDSTDYIFSLLESTPLLTTVGFIDATDTDSNSNDLTYSLVDPEIEMFYVNPSTGEIVLSVALDFETVQQYRFNVSVSDRGSFDGSNILSSTSSVLVNVNNTNDNQPMFSNGGIYGRTIPETTPVGTSILTISCTDNDAAPFGSPSITSNDFEDIPFELVDSTNEVRVSGELMGEAIYFVNITCRDGGQQTVDGLVFLFVPEPSAPTFSQPGYDWSVSELAAVGTAFIEINATSDDNSAITYSIVDGNGDQIFYIDPSSGAISLVLSLDYEQQMQHALVVRAVDEAERQSVVLFLVQVEDANDDLPLIPPSALLRIRQNESPGYPVGVVECIDADANINNTAFNYTFSPSSDLFSVDESGIIRLEVGLNNTPVYVLPIVCFDIRDPDVNSTGIVTIEVEFVNLHQPVFQNPLYIFQVLEDSPSLSPIGDPVVATDNDIGSFSQLVYSIGDEQNQFYVDAETGRIRLLTALDRESEELYSLTVLAIDGGPSAVDSSRMTGSTTVMVIVEDTNDNAPTPNQLSYVQSITTNHTVLSPVLSVNCSDPDLGNNGNLQYSLSPVDTLDNFIIQPSNGTILLAREQLNQAVYTFFAVCADRGDPSLNTSFLVTITVNFIALSSPVFNQDHYNVSISEDIALTTSILTVQATPSDPSITVVYDLNGGNDRESFFVNSITGEISVRNPLDAREQQIYTLTIRAGNTGSDQLFSYATVSMFVEDINDNSPIFESQFYTGMIREGSILSTPVLGVMCTDSDVNSEISYTLMEGMSIPTEFSITQDGQIVVSGNVDYELVTGFSLEVTCSDGGLAPRTAVATVRIDVIPVNEFPPQLMRDEYTFEATENDFGALIGRVNATDEDDGPHGSITYLLQDPGNFSVIFVDPISGDVFVSNNLDYEAQPFWNLSVIARDGGGLESSVLLNIEVINVNDVPPLITPSSSVHNILVDEESNFPVQSYICSDPDGISTTLSIFNGNSEGYFELVDNVVVWTGSAFNLTDNFISSFTLRCQDDLDSEQYDDSLITINIIVTDAVQPVFSQQLYAVSVSEDTHLNTTLFRVSAEGENPLLLYTVLNLLSDFPIDIDPLNGSVYLIRPLDREVESFLSFHIAATDLENGASGITLVEVTVTDVNDNSPIITPPMQSVRLPEDFPLSTSFAVFMCTDIDTRGNDNIIFQITERDTFDIDSNGLVSLSRSLNFELRGNYTLEVTCSDGEVSPLMDTATLLVIVDGINEYPPVFSNSTYYFFVSEFSRTGDMVGRVSASDLDSGLFGDITYSVLSGSGVDYFTLSANGFIFNSILPLNATEHPTLQLNIRATDGGGLHSDSTVIVTVGDVNQPPLFTSSGSYFVRASTDLAEDSILLQFTCYDTDVGDNSVVDLELSSPPASLDIVLLSTERANSRDAQLIARSSLPGGSYVLNVTCSDRGNPSISLSTSVTVRVDVLNTPPQFINNILTLAVHEDIIPGTLIFVANATDSETGVAYGITGGTGLGTFQIDNTTGEVTNVLPLDYEVISTYSLIITATDLSLLEPLSTSIEAFVAVINVNDIPPILLPGARVISLQEDADPSIITSLVSYVCSDPDGSTTSISISLEGSSSLFSLSPANEVLLSHPVDYEVAMSHTINVTCTDSEVRSGEGVNLQQYSILTVIVVPVNIHPPVFISPSSFEITENAIIGDVVGILEAEDDDIRGLVTFSSTSNADTFHVGTSGNITVLRGLDYEEAVVYRLTVLATDNDNAPNVEPRTTTSMIMIRVTDENDNQPTCINNVLTASFETGSYNDPFIILARLNCSDRDDGSNALLRYSILNETLPSISQGNFFVDTGAGELRFRGSISVSGSHVIEILVEDSGVPVLSTRVSVAVRVDNANSTRPQFNQSLFRVDISEDLFSPAIILPGVVIRNNFYNPLGDNVVYTFQPSEENNGIFIIDRVNADVTLTNNMLLDYEREQQYTLILEAHINSVTETAIIEVNILDFNDNSPMFPRSIYGGSVLENQPVGTSILTVMATDIDSGENALFEYSIEGSSLNLEIDPTSGNITTARMFDREVNEVYTIIVLATDMGVPPLTGSTTVTISITDLNDQSPSFIDSFYRVSINNTIRPGDVVVALRAEDEDEVGTLTYEIDDEEAVSLFVVDGDGIIRLRSTGLSQDHQSRYNFSVIVSDGIATDAATVVVYIFSITTDTVILEENVRGERYDARAFLMNNFNSMTLSSNASYSIIQGDPFGEFEIDSTGIVAVVETLDRENTSRYDLSIEVLDDVINIELFVTVTVLDQNDNAPMFENEIYMFNVSEGPYQDAVSFGQVTATDLDQPNTGASTIEYNFVKPEDKYIIDPATGELFVKGGVVLDREMTQNVTLLVEARDFGEPSPLFNTALLELTLNDINDNDPEFVPLATEEYFVLLPEEKVEPNTILDKIAIILPKGIRIEVSSITVTHPDSSSRITASLEGGEDGIKFGFVDSKSSELQLVTIDEVTKDDFGTVLQIVLRDQPIDEEDNPIIKNITFLSPSDYVEPTPKGLEPVVPFFQTEAGIAIIVVICVLILALVVFFILLLCYLKNRREKDPLKEGYRTTTIAQRILTEADRKGKKFGKHYDYSAHSHVNQLEFPDLSPVDYETGLLYPPGQEREESFMGDFESHQRKPFIPLPGDEFGDPIHYGDDTGTPHSLHSALMNGSHADPFGYQETDTSVLSSLQTPHDLDDSLNSFGEEYTMGPILKAMLEEWERGDELLVKKKRQRKISREQN